MMQLVLKGYWLFGSAKKDLLTYRQVAKEQSRHRLAPSDMVWLRPIAVGLQCISEFTRSQFHDEDDTLMN